MLQISALAIWLQGLGAQQDLWPGPALPNIPTEYVLLTPFGGPGMTTEQEFEVVGVQVRCTGPQGNLTGTDRFASIDGTQKTAYDLDRMLLTACDLGPVDIGSVRCIRIARAGSGPSPMAADNADRQIYVCSYLLEVATGI